MGRVSRGFQLAALLGATAASARASQASPWIIDSQTKCYVFYTDTQLADAVTWTGDCANGAATGQGVATFTKEGRFVAQISAKFDGGAASGAVRANWADGAHFEGEEQAGRFNGQGALTTANGDRFEGVWANGRMNGRGSVKWADGDTYEGDWRDSKAEGHGVQRWADGRRYEGEWKDDLPDGHGVLTHKDGSIFEGEFRAGEPKPATGVAGSSTPTAPPAAQLPASSAAGPSATTASDTPAAGNLARWVDAYAAQKLVAVDGSSVVLSATDNGWSRQLLSPGGAAETLNFTLLNRRQGTVASVRDGNQVIGTFQLGDASLDIDYADGRMESLSPAAGGGLSMTARSSNASSCMAWYPQGHAFSTAEREAALAAYAGKLGLAVPGGKHNVAVSACGPRAGADSLAAAPVAVPPAAGASEHRQPKTRHGHVAATKTAALDIAPGQPIEVRQSQIHPIDAPAAAPSGSSLADRAAHCLSVEANGAQWGFRNACAFSVQFAYCVMGGSDERNSCEGGGVGGAVPANSFDALFAESALKAEHDLRWIACEGAAGDVVPRLVQADPPAGRCVHARAS